MLNDKSSHPSIDNVPVLVGDFLSSTDPDTGDKVVFKVSSIEWDSVDYGDGVTGWVFSDEAGDREYPCSECSRVSPDRVVRVQTAPGMLTPMLDGLYAVGPAVSVPFASVAAETLERLATLAASHPATASNPSLMEAVQQARFAVAVALQDSESAVNESS